MRRNTGGSNYNEQEESSFLSLPMRKNDANKPSAQELMNEAVKFGYLKKRNNSVWVYYFSCFFPKWKSRYFILVGNFLFRFSSENGESPKGVPIPLGIYIYLYINAHLLILMYAY
jgi:hypothetical protein